MKIRVWDTNLKIRLIGEGLFNLLYWMYFPFITVYFSEEIGNQMAGLLMSIPPLIGMLGNMVGGDLTDRFGRRSVMLLGSLIKTVMFAIFALSHSHWLDYLAFIGVGFGNALYGPASHAMVADLVPENERKQVFATFITANNIGAVLGPALGAFFFFHYRSELLWICTIVMLLYSIAIFTKINETLPDYIKKDGQTKTTISLIKEQWQSYKIILLDKTFFLYLLAGVFAIITIMQLDLYLAVYVTSHVPSQPLLLWREWSIFLSSTEILGWILGFNGLLFVLFVLPVTKWLKGWRDRDVLILSSILSGAGMFAVGLTSNIWCLFLITIVFTFGEIIRSPVINNFVSSYAPVEARGRYMGASNLQYTIGRFLAPITVFLSAWIPPIGIFSFILICAFISVYFYFKVFKRMEVTQKEKSVSPF
ncbi:predicted MFS family arabinose efflux permease [Bacillus oleivorans]|uniref:Predicted MFS family arabinose efflux permease n=1 Tax=Bacillus oleivorans TaxID=1448271 RepID=A0A285CMA3_9BACI|nr:MFS transporter [Bacillus oleivorans]SNX68661.1 predicted MFS family arabinose efflux permease [Bacillus oleivorans]